MQSARPETCKHLAISPEQYGIVLLALMLSLHTKSMCYDVRINYAQLNSRPAGVPELLIFFQSVDFLIALSLFKFLSLLEFNLKNFQILDSYLSDWLTFIIKLS